MKKIRLTESDLHRIVRRAVERIMEDFSAETLASAKEKALDKMVSAPTGSPEYNKRKEQYSTFNKGFHDIRDKNDHTRASVDRRLKDVKTGKRKYQKGRGWVTDTDQD